MQLNLRRAKVGSSEVSWVGEAASAEGHMRGEGAKDANPSPLAGMSCKLLRPLLSFILLLEHAALLTPT